MNFQSKRIRTTIFMILVAGLLLFAVALTPAANADSGAPATKGGFATIAGEAFAAPHQNRAGGSSYTTGFDSSEGYAPGFCGGQNGWVAFPDSTTEGHIDVLNPASGDQHLRISKDSSIGTGIPTGCFSPLITALPGPSSTSIDMYVSGPGGADYGIAPYSSSDGTWAAFVSLDWLGGIEIHDGSSFVPTGADWVAGEYKTLRIDIDPGAGIIEYFYDGVLIYTGGLLGTTTVDQVVLLSDNWHVDDYGDYDNLSFGSTEPPTAVEMADLSTTVGAEGSITVAWSTASEFSNAGFNVYRSETSDTSGTIINSELIASSAAAGSGANYNFVDSPDFGTFYYSIEAVAIDGSTSLHGPVEAVMQAPTSAGLTQFGGNNASLLPALLATVAIIFVALVLFRRRAA